MRKRYPADLSQRRQWLRTGLVAALLASAWARATPAPVIRGGNHHLPLLKPPRLRPGDWVSIISPSGHVSDERLQRSVLNLESLGLKVKLGAHVRARSGNYAGAVGARVADFHHAFLDPEVKAIWPSRGGSGAALLLPHIDYRLVRSRPKIVIGFSDITALLIALYRHAGLASFHGVVSGSQFAPYSVAQLHDTLFAGRSKLTIELPPEQRSRALQSAEDAPLTLRSGVAEGPLVGGNLAVLTSLIGTPDAAPLAGHLLFLEEVGEAPYRLDRMLTQLQRSAGFERTRGVAMGVFRDASEAQRDAAAGMVTASPNPGNHTLQQVLTERFAAVNQPSAYGLPFGHIAPQCVLPIGIRARLDADAHTLTLLESAVT